MNPETTFIQFESQSENPHFENVYDIEPKELYEKLQTSPSIQLIDVRETGEYNGELGHIANTQLISLGTIPQNLPNLATDKTLVFVCRSGGRSAQATAYALSKGFKSVYNMRGGMLLWNQLALPTE